MIIGRKVEQSWRKWRDLPTLDSNRLGGSTRSELERIRIAVATSFGRIQSILPEVERAIREEDQSVLSQLAQEAKDHCEALGAQRLSALFEALIHEGDIVDAELIYPHLKVECAQARACARGLGLYGAAIVGTA